MEDVGCRLVTGEHDHEGIASDLFFAKTFVLGGAFGLCLGSLCII